MNSIASDTSFFSCFFCHLQDEYLIFLLDNYSFVIGPKIKEELPHNFHFELMNYYDYDYYSLVKPFFNRSEEHIHDGEYEAIGIGQYLYNKSELKYLIIDDRKPYKFVKNNFSHLIDYLTGTIGFIGLACLNDNIIDDIKAESLLNSIKVLVEVENSIRPCSMDLKNYKKIIDPIIQKIRCKRERF